MLEFLNEEVRQEFHLLPLDRQRMFLGMADRLSHEGFRLKILMIDRLGTQSSEVSIRIYEKFDEIRSGVIA